MNSSYHYSDMNDHSWGNLKVEFQWGRTGLWESRRDSGWREAFYENYQLPEWLVQKFKYWTGWAHTQKMFVVERSMDWDAFNSYGWALSIDLKRVLGEPYRVYWMGKTVPARTGTPRNFPANTEEIFLPADERPWQNIIWESDFKPVEVEFHNCQSGWIELYVTAGADAVHVPCSYVFDPFPRFIEWLENIVSGQPRCVLRVDTEGYVVRFMTNRKSDDQMALTIAGENDGRLFVVKLVDPVQCVQAFYGGLRSFAESAEYKPEEWEPRRLLDRAGAQAADLVERLAAMPRLKCWETIVSLFSVADLSEAFGILHHDRDAAPPIIPPSPLTGSYDEWSQEQKRDYLKEYLETPLNGKNGTKLRELCSQKIEAWLKK